MHVVCTDKSDRHFVSSANLARIKQYRHKALGTLKAVRGLYGEWTQPDQQRSSIVWERPGRAPTRPRFFRGLSSIWVLGTSCRGDFVLKPKGGYAHYSAESVSPLSTNGAFPLLNGNRLELQSGGARDQYLATFNAFYDLPMFGQFIPDVGAGIGGKYRQFTRRALRWGRRRAAVYAVGGSGTNAAVLGEVGMTITLNAKWSVVPSYRFEKVFTNAGAFPNQANIFKLGLRYSL